MKKELIFTGIAAGFIVGVGVVQAQDVLAAEVTDENKIATVEDNTNATGNADTTTDDAQKTDTSATTGDTQAQASTGEETTASTEEETPETGEYVAKIGDTTYDTLDGTKANSKTHGIYAWNDTEINLNNGSVLTIQNFTQDAIEWDGNNHKYNITLNNGSEYVSDHNRSAITGTWNVTVNDSKMTWTNCSGNGSNGSYFYFTNSEFLCDTTGSWGHGLSAADLIIKNSKVTCKNVGLRGITLFGTLLVDSTSEVYCLDNGTSTATTTGAGLCLAKSTTVGTVEKGAVVVITGTQKNGLENYGTLTFEDGSTLIITDNDNTSSNGGGIYNGSTGTIVLPANADITNNHAAKTGGGILNAGTITMGENVSLYNNHADVAGDDVYQRDGGTITLNKTGDDWCLDGEPDCTHKITGWFEDGNNDDGLRWLADTSDKDARYVVEEEAGTLTGVQALKAAHGVLTYNVVVNYVDEYGNVIDQQVIVKDIDSFDGYDVSEYNQKDIDGYIYLRTDGDVVTGTPEEQITEDAVVNVVYKKKATPSKSERPAVDTGVETEFVTFAGTAGVAALGAVSASLKRRQDLKRTNKNKHLYK